MERPDAETTLLHRVGRAIAQARLSRGWTQDTLAHALGISVKNAQRLESGRHDLRLTTLARAAAALGVDLALLLAPDDDAGTQRGSRADGPLAGLQATGWQVVRRRTEPTEALVPVLDLRPQAGKPRAQASTTWVGWARPPEGRHLHAEGLVLARVRGDSMAPEIPDGTWCLFHQPASDLQVRKRVLVRVAEEDPAAPGGFVVKRIGAIEAANDGLRLRLDSSNPDHAPTWLDVREADTSPVVAELVEVLGPPGRRIRR